MKSQSALRSVLQSRNLSDWLKSPTVECVPVLTLHNMLWCSPFEAHWSSANMQYRITTDVPYDCLPSELATFRPGFEQEKLRDLPRVFSYGSLLELNLRVGIATSYLQTQQLGGNIRGTNSDGLNDPPAFGPSVLGTLWPFESYAHDVVSNIFRHWHRCKQFPKLCETFTSFGFTAVDSMSYFSTSFCIGDICVPVGAAVDVTSSAFGKESYQQKDRFARQQLVAANLPLLALMAISCCHVDDEGNFAYKPLSEAFVFGIAILDQEVMIELLVPYFESDSRKWKIYSCPCHSIVLGDLTLARMRPHYKYLQLLNYMSTIRIHHQTLASKLVGHRWDEDVSVAFAQSSSVN